MAKSETNKAVANLMDWIRRENRWAAPFEATLEAHTASARSADRLSHEDLAEILGDAGSGLLFGCVFEDLTAQHFEDIPHNLVDDYLKRRGWRDSVPCRRYMEALRDAIMSVYEVTGVSPGQWVEVRDLARGGEPVRVFEHMGSKQMVRWDRIGARVVDHLGQKVFTGAILSYSVEQSEELLRRIEAKIAQTLATRGLKRSSPDHPEVRTAIADTLATMPSAFTSCWLTGQITARNAALPALVNFEGDPITFAETRFVVREGAAAEIVSRLDALKDLRRVDQTPPTWSWLGMIEPRRNTAGEGLSLQTHDAATGGQVFGNLELVDGALRLSTNSVTRMNRGKEMLHAALGELIGTGLTSLTSVEETLRQSRETAPTKSSAKDEVPPEIAAGIMREFSDRHYRAWIGTPLPALDGRSPRQAVRTKRGRDEVVALLKKVENMEARRSRESGQPPYDFAWLWQELGVETRRR